MSVKRSGLQRDVLALYRRGLRMVKSKPIATRPKFLLFVRFTFHTNATSIAPSNVSAIEYLLRRWRRQLEAYAEPEVKDCWVSADMVAWDKARLGFRHRNLS